MARTKTVKERLQDRIQERFPEQVKTKRQDLCKSCVHFSELGCKHGLLPVTTNGESCPYFEKRQEE